MRHPRVLATGVMQDLSVAYGYRKTVYTGGRSLPEDGYLGVVFACAQNPVCMLMRD